MQVQPRIRATRAWEETRKISIFTVRRQGLGSMSKRKPPPGNAGPLKLGTAMKTSFTETIRLVLKSGYFSYVGNRRPSNTTLFPSTFPRKSISPYLKSLVSRYGRATELAHSSWEANRTPPTVARLWLLAD